MPDSKFPTIGILGGGQLGRMTALAAIRMGLTVRFLVPKPAGPVEGLGTTLVGDWNAPDVAQAFADGCDVVTVESEWAPAEVMAALPEPPPVWPSPDTLRIIRDKGLQKRTLAASGLPLPAFACCATLEAALGAAEGFGYPVVLKKYRGSYDGYGNATAHNPEDLRQAWPRLADEDGALVEAWVPFVRELAVLVARTPQGAQVVYPVAFSEQRDHRCHAVVVPADIPAAVAAEAEAVSQAAVAAVQGVGITAVELFEMPDGQVLVNELAPRPHNSGHYSIDGCHTSQFENHVRAILGWPLGNPALRAPVAVMVNILGHREGLPSLKGYAEALALPGGVSVHIYGKKEVRPRRKMGHVNATGTDAAETLARAEQAATLIQL